MKFSVMATLPEAVALSGAAVMSEFRRLYGRNRFKFSLSEESTDDAAVFVISGIRILAGTEESPIPPAISSFALQTVGSWEGASDALNTHKAHLKIAVLDQPIDHKTAFAAASAVTIVGAAIVASLPVTTVLFVQSALLKSPANFVSSAVDYVERRELPVDLWVSVVSDVYQAERRDDPMAFSLGLQPFIGREIELYSSQYEFEDICYRVLDAASYLIWNGPIVSDGQTMGFSSKERIRVRYKDEGVRQKVPILELRVETPDFQPRMFKV